MNRLEQSRTSTANYRGKVVHVSGKEKLSGYDLVILPDGDAQGDYREQAWRFDFGAYGNSSVIVWARGFEGALDKAADFVHDHWPGLLTEPDYADAERDWCKENAPPVPPDHNPQPLEADYWERQRNKAIVTCGQCGRHWDGDAYPTPAARCPFEYFHADPTTDEAQEAIREAAETDLTYVDPGIWIAEWRGGELDRDGILAAIRDQTERGRDISVMA